MMVVNMTMRAAIWMTFVGHTSLHLFVPASDAVHTMGRLVKLPVPVQEILPTMRPNRYAIAVGTEFAQRTRYAVESAVQLTVAVTTMWFGHLHTIQVRWLCACVWTQFILFWSTITLIWIFSWILGINVEVGGYTTLLQNQKVTCNDKYRLESFPNSNVTRCKVLCDQEIGCKYFHFNDGEYCVLYSSCIDRRTPGFYGSTYKKQGNCKNT